MELRGDPQSGGNSLCVWDEQSLPRDIIGSVQDVTGLFKLFHSPKPYRSQLKNTVE